MAVCIASEPQTIDPASELPPDGAITTYSICLRSTGERHSGNPATQWR